MQIQKIRLEQIHPTDNQYNNYHEQILGTGTHYLERFVATDDQSVFVLGRNYDNNDPNNKLKVFVNGMLMNKGGDYLESSSNTITFQYGLFEGDIVRVRINSVGGTFTFTDHRHIDGEVPPESTNGVNKVFSVSRVIRQNTECIFKDGILMYPGSNHDYIISNGLVTFKTAPSSGSKVSISYIY